MKHSKCLLNKNKSMNKKINTIFNISNNYFNKYNNNGNEFDFVKYEITHDLHEILVKNVHTINNMGQLQYDFINKSLTNVIKFKNNNMVINNNHIIDEYQKMLLWRFKLNNAKLKTLDDNDVILFEMLRLNRILDIYDDLVMRQHLYVFEENHMLDRKTEMFNVIKYDSLVVTIIDKID